MRQFKFATYTEVTDIAKKKFPELEYCDGVLICPDTNDIWIAFIQKGINENYEDDPNSTLVERCRLPYEDVGLTASRLIHSPQGAFSNLTKRILQTYVDSDGSLWDNKAVESVGEAFDLLDDGYGIIRA